MSRGSRVHSDSRARQRQMPLEEERRGEWEQKKKQNWGCLVSKRTRHDEVLVVVISPDWSSVAHRTGNLNLLHVPVVLIAVAVVDLDIFIVAVQELDDFDVAPRHRARVGFVFFFVERSCCS